MKRYAYTSKHLKDNNKGERPRLAVFCSNSHIYAQLIDDKKSMTLAAASTCEKSLRGEEKTTGCTAAKKIGEVLADRALDKGYKKVVFDRRHYKFHGRVAALAQGAREKGLIF